MVGVLARDPQGSVGLARIGDAGGYTSPTNTTFGAQGKPVSLVDARLRLSLRGWAIVDRDSETSVGLNTEIAKSLSEVEARLRVLLDGTGALRPISMADLFEGAKRVSQSVREGTMMGLSESGAGLARLEGRFIEWNAIEPTKSARNDKAL